MKTLRKADIKGQEERRKARLKALDEDEEDRSYQSRQQRHACKDKQPKHVAIEEQLHLNLPSATLDDSLHPGAAPRPSSVFGASPLTPSGPMYLTCRADTHPGSRAPNIYLSGSIDMIIDGSHPGDSAPQKGTAEQNIYLTGSTDRSSNEVDLIDFANRFVTRVKAGGLTSCVGASAIQDLLTSVIQKEFAACRQVFGD